jgi:hypothetical protein
MRSLPRSRLQIQKATLPETVIAAMGVRIPYGYEPVGMLDIETLADLHAELALRMLGGR